MRSFTIIATVFLFVGFASQSYGINHRVVEVLFPDEDVVVGYIEGDPFTVKLRAKDTSVRGIKYYIGDGTISLELLAHPTNGVFLQGEKIENGHVFKKGAAVKVLPGYSRRDDLTPGTVYVVLPGAKFEIPEQK